MSSPVLDSARPSADTKIRLTLNVPETTYILYEKQAATKKITPEREMALRLESCSGHVSGRPLYLTDSDRSKLEELTGRQLDTVSDLVKLVESLCTIKLGSYSVQLPSNLLTRAESRASSYRMDTRVWLTQEVIKGLEESVGLR